MKIWLDLTNSPHINFFKPFIKKWDDEGYEVIITARNLANTLSLIEQNGWEYAEIGGHAGKNKIKKLMYFPKRVCQLYYYLKENKPDIGISHSSFYSPLVCRLLKIPSIYLNDNEHAKGNYIAFKFATLNIIPEFLEKKAEKLKWTSKYNIIFYPGIKEGIYLSHLDLSDSNVSDKKDTIYIRLEPWTAQYYSGDTEFMDPIIEELGKKYKIVILPRSKEQIIHFKDKCFNNVFVSESPLSLNVILKTAIIFIGAGGSMTRELAFLGVPTISIYQGELLEVDKYLVENNFMIHNRKPNVDDILDVFRKKHVNDNQSLIKKGNDAFDLINKSLLQCMNNRTTI